MDLFAFDPPTMTADAAAEVAAAHWGVRGEPVRIRGERTANTIITEPDGSGFVLQVHSAAEHADAIELQTAAMLHVAGQDATIPIPHVVPSLSGRPLVAVEIEARQHTARLVTYLPGTTFDDGAALPRDGYVAIGALVGRVAAALREFDHPAAGHFMPWDVANGLVVDDDLRSLLSGRAADAVASVDERLRAVTETAAALPQQTVHNDGHAGNLLRADDSATMPIGLIDFGDVVHTARVADVAIIAESFAPSAADPAAVLAAVTAGYVPHQPLTDVEIDALPELVLARAALNVLLGEYQRRNAHHLREHAEAASDWVVDRLVRWRDLDRTALVQRIREEPVWTTS